MASSSKQLLVSKADFFKGDALGGFALPKVFFQPQTTAMRHFPIFSTLIVLFCASPAFGQKLSYQILEGSTLSISGSSNVHDFTCLCIQEFEPGTVNMAVAPRRTDVSFSASDLKIATRQLDCGKKLMNQDMYKTLRADDFPFILITLKKVIQDPEYCLSTCTDWIELHVVAEIAIAGTCRLVPMVVEARQIQENTYRFVSQAKLAMTQFNIAPPEALMGMIKVNDQIRIDLDLSVTLPEPVSAYRQNN